MHSRTHTCTHILTHTNTRSPPSRDSGDVNKAEELLSDICRFYSEDQWTQLSTKAYSLLADCQLKLRLDDKYPPTTASPLSISLHCHVFLIVFARVYYMYSVCRCRVKVDPVPAVPPGIPGSWVWSGRGQQVHQSIYVYLSTYQKKKTG